MLIAAWKDASLGGRGDVATSSVPVMSVAGCGRCQQNTRRTENKEKRYARRPADQREVGGWHQNATPIAVFVDAQQSSNTPTVEGAGMKGSSWMTYWEIAKNKSVSFSRPPSLPSVVSF